MVNRTSQTNRLSGRAQSTPETDDCAYNNDAAHGRRPLFRAVQFRQVTNFLRAPDRLAHLQRNQFADDEVAEISETRTPSPPLPPRET